MENAPIYWHRPMTLQIATSEETDDETNWMLEYRGYKQISHAQWNFYRAILSLKDKIRRN